MTRAIVVLVLLAGVPAAPLLAQLRNEVAYCVDQRSRTILKLDFAAAATTVVNTDARSRRSLEGLAVRDDLARQHLIAADPRGGQVLFYEGARGAGKRIATALPGATALSLDGGGRIFVATTPSRPGTRPKLFTLARGGGRPGGYHDPRLLDGAVPVLRVVDTRSYPGTAGLLSTGDLVVLGQVPSTLFRYPRQDSGFGARATLIPPSAFPSGVAPVSLGFLPSGVILVAMGNGSVLRFDTQGVRLSPDFATGLPSGPMRLAMGVQGGANRVLVAAGNKVYRYTIRADDTGQLADTVGDDLQQAGGVSLPAGAAVPTPVGEDVEIAPAPEVELHFDEVTTAGYTSVRVISFADNRPGPVDQSLRAFFPDDPALQTELPDVVLPAHIQAFRAAAPGDPPGGPYSGPPTFVLAVVDTTAVFARTVGFHGLEEVVLHHNPPCTERAQYLQSRTFYVPEISPPKSEPPIVEGPVFTDFSTGCGSNIGRGSRFSLWLTASDSRPTRMIVNEKLDNLDAALASYAGLIGASVRTALSAQVGAARTAYAGGNVPGAQAALASFVTIVDANPGAFAPNPANVPGELIARAESGGYLMGKTGTAVDVTVGDNDGFGYSIPVPDNGSLPNLLFTDNRSAAEQSASDGSQHTDLYTALSTLYPNMGLRADVTFPVPPLGAGVVEMDLGGFEGDDFGDTIRFLFNGIDQNLRFDDGPSSTRVHRIALGADVLDSISRTGQLVVTIDRFLPYGDFVAFDYFRLIGEEPLP
jgi:hypothetical protein